MNLKSKVATLAVLSSIGMTAIAGATTVGVVNMAAVMNSYPGLGAVQMQEKQVQDQYGPQIQKEIERIKGLKTQAEQQKAFQEKVVPLEQKAQADLQKVWAPVQEKVFKTIEAVRVQKQLPFVFVDPAAAVGNPQDKNNTIENVTNDVINALK